MARRQRLTWRDRQASPPPATPGYGTDEHDHPAMYPDPGPNQYETGDTSSWAEDPMPGPYTQSAPPATPGYGTPEMGDHPAAKRGSVRGLVEARAAKALRMASAMLGPGAPDDAIDDQALDLMDLDDNTFNSTYQRLASVHKKGFLYAMDDEECGEMGCGSPMAGGYAMDQNDPDYMGMDEMDEEGMLAQMLDEEVMEDDVFMDEPMMDEPMMDEPMMDEIYGMFPRAAARKLGFDDNGFVYEDEWKGDRNMFASLDTDGDGIVSIRELETGLFGSPTEGPSLYADYDPEERRMLAAMGVIGADDDDEEEEEETEAKKKAADEEVEEEVVEEDEKESKKKAADDEEEDDEADKEASMFSPMSDPMGLSGEPTLSAEDDALLSEIFSGKTAADDEDDDEEEEDEEEEDEEEEDEEEEDEKEAKKKKATRTASQKPRPRKQGKGPRSLGAVTKTAGGKDEISELSKLWASDPNINDLI